jgi:hypothetical protein
LPSVDVEAAESGFALVTDWPLITDWPLVTALPELFVTLPLVMELGTAASRGSEKDRFPEFRDAFAGLLAVGKPWF